MKIKEKLNTPVTWGGYLKLCGVCGVISIVSTLASYVCVKNYY